MKNDGGFVETIHVGETTIKIRGRAANDSANQHFAIHLLPPYIAIPDRIANAPDLLVHAAESDGGRFSVTLDRFFGGQDRLFSKFAAGSRTADDAATTVLPGVCFANELGPIARYAYAYPTASTIKGLQVRDVADALKLGVGHAALNLNLPNIARPSADEATITYTMDGRDYYFDADYLRRFDQELKALSDHGIVVNLILLNSMKWDNVEIHPAMHDVLLHPDYDREGFISAFNVTTEEGVNHYRAFVEFVAERYTRPDQRYGRACGFIIGNEVDAQWVWCNAGEKEVAAYMRDHGLAMRIAHYAARKQYAAARVYLSLTHHWCSRWEVDGEGNPRRAYHGRDVVETLNAQAQQEGDYAWALAYHPYPENLFHANFWDDASAQDSFETPRITFRNLQVLPRYFSQPHLLYNGRQRHIILSEQGFHSDETEAGERLQAAAYAFAYWKVEQEPTIESFILHAHVDNRDEFDLNLGIRRRDKSSDLPSAPGDPKPVYAIFRDIDGPRHDEIMAEAKRFVGEEKWK